MQSKLWIGVIAACLLIGRATAAETQVTEGFINLPAAEVWRLFTTAEGYKKSGAAQADVDLRISGRIRSHDNPNAQLGDAETTVMEILAFEPERMLALRLQQAPASFPHRDAATRAWTVIYLNPAGDMTQVKIVDVGLTGDASSQAFKQFAAQAHRQRLDRLAKDFWPQCALCKAEADDQ